jgi:hypothetical protein
MRDSLVLYKFSVVTISPMPVRYSAIDSAPPVAVRDMAGLLTCMECRPCRDDVGLLVHVSVRCRVREEFLWLHPS